MTPTPAMQQMRSIIQPGLLHVATILGVLLALLLVSHILHSPRAPAVTMGWLLIIILVPVIGVPRYLIFGAHKIIIVDSDKVWTGDETSRRSISGQTVPTPVGLILVFASKDRQPHLSEYFLQSTGY